MLHVCLSAFSSPLFRNCSGLVKLIKGFYFTMVDSLVKLSLKIAGCFKIKVLMLILSYLFSLQFYLFLFY